jgi:thioester reductase-like protein
LPNAIAAIYDITADEAEQRAANVTYVDATRSVINLARRLDATLHHVSSIAVAGDFAGEYTEDDFDVGQQLPTAYHQAMFEAESLVRSTPGLRYRVYRPAVVVGDSHTGEMDKIDGPYTSSGYCRCWLYCPSSRRSCCPTRGASTSFRSTTSSRRSSR